MALHKSSTLPITVSESINTNYKVWWKWFVILYLQISSVCWCLFKGFRQSFLSITFHFCLVSCTLCCVFRVVLHTQILSSL